MQLVNVREGPGVSFAAFEAVEPGTGLLILGQTTSGDWYNVRLEDGREGWLSSRLLYIPPTPTTVPGGAVNSLELTAMSLGEGLLPVPTVPLSVRVATATAVGQSLTPGSIEQAVIADETQPFLPLVDMDEINLTATALAAGAASATPTLPPTMTAVVVANATSAPPSGSTPPETDGVDVFAFCDLPQFGIPPPSGLRAGATIDVYWAWLAREESQIRDHLDAVTYEVRVNGQLISSRLAPYRSAIRQQGGDYAVYWYVPFGPLEAGEVRITYRVSWNRVISDGYAQFGPGTSKPFEEKSCTFLVGE